MDIRDSIESVKALLRPTMAIDKSKASATREKASITRGVFLYGFPFVMCKKKLLAGQAKMFELVHSELVIRRLHE